MNCRAPFALALLPSPLLVCLSADARPAVPITHPAPDRRSGSIRKSSSRQRAAARDEGVRADRLQRHEDREVRIEILGIIAKFNQGKDYILFRAPDGPPVTRSLNIAARHERQPDLHQRAFGRRDLAGQPVRQRPDRLATPIEEMLDAWSPDLPSKVQHRRVGSGLGSTNGALDGWQLRRSEMPLASAA